jgi:NAD-dependent deacetylase
VIEAKGEIMAGQLDRHASIVILTGAGISAESGLGTFRDKDGIWTKYPIEDLATPEGFARNPGFVQDFYNSRRRGLMESHHHAGHEALARLEAEWPGRVTIVTQNVDDLHERAGSRNVLHMHGELRKAQCTACEAVLPWDDDLGTETPCPACRTPGGLRPNVVWFGEIPFYLDEIEAALLDCKLFAAIGTSGNVYPAASFVQAASGLGAHTVELNLEASENNWAFGETHLGPASEIVPRWVDDLLRRA